MKRLTQLLPIVTLLILQPSNACGETLPIEQGKKYYMTFVDKNPIPLLQNGSPVLVKRIFDYPWIEVEYTWTPTVEVDENGNRVEPPTTTTHRVFLNLERVVVIKSLSQK